MRGIAILLSLVILILSITPCSDGNNTEDKHQDKISASHNHQEDSDDSCPITCACNCCGISITYQLPQAFKLKPNIELSTRLVSTYQLNYRFDLNATIWQPPQLIS